MNTPTKDQESVLSVAVGLNLSRVAKPLVEHGANVNVVDEHGLSPLIWAILYNDVALVQVLLEHGAQVNHQSEDGWTALHYAIRYCQNKDILRQLRKHQASINLPNKQGLTPLTMAQENQQFGIVDLLRHSGK